MEIVQVLLQNEQSLPKLPELNEIIRVPAWLVRFTDNIVSIIIATAVHDNRLDI